VTRGTTERVALGERQRPSPGRTLPDPGARLGANQRRAFTTEEGARLEVGVRVSYLGLEEML